MSHGSNSDATFPVTRLRATNGGRLRNTSVAALARARSGSQGSTGAPACRLGRPRRKLSFPRGTAATFPSGFAWSNGHSARAQTGTGEGACAPAPESARGSLNLNQTAISGVPAFAEGWGYDPTGNWGVLKQWGSTGQLSLDQDRVHDRGNRLTQIVGNAAPVLTDRAGRILQSAPDAAGDWGGRLELVWDAWSRIVQVGNNGGYVGTYAYDGLHRRITRNTGGVVWHTYYSDTWRPLEERKNSETTAAIIYLWGARHRDDLARRDRAVGGSTLNETRYVLMDYFNPAAITDATGAVKERYAFSAFGVRSILNPDWTARTASESAFEFAFQGQFLDTESGLYNYGYRYYLPYLGRWMCKDPIGESGDTNLYDFVHNSPLNRLDYLGLFDWWNYVPNPGDRPGGGKKTLFFYICYIKKKLKPTKDAPPGQVCPPLVGEGSGWDKELALINAEHDWAKKTVPRCCEPTDAPRTIRCDVVGPDAYLPDPNPDAPMLT